MLYRFMCRTYQIVEVITLFANSTEDIGFAISASTYMVKLLRCVMNR